MDPLDQVIQLFTRLPGVGRKSATRMAYFLLKEEASYSRGFGQSIMELKEKIHSCSECGNYTEEDPCRICSDTSRDGTLMCVVEQPQDVLTIESTGEYRGFFHILGGVLSPIDGIGPDQLGLGRLIDRVLNLGVSEVIIATNPTMEGDSTALYIQHLLKEKEVRVTRIASGLPVGGDLEYADKLSIARSLRSRQSLDQ